MEIWKDIKGYEGIYQASNTGKIRSVDRVRKVIGSNKFKKNYTYTRFYKGKELVGGLDKDGYRIGVFYDSEGKRKTLKFHRLIAQTFIPNPNNFPEVNHKNGNKQDNDISNLEWVTTQQNVQHAFKTGLRQGKRKPVARLDKNTLEVLQIYPSVASTAKEGYNPGHVGGCCRGDRGRVTHKGYRWRFLEDLETCNDYRKHT